jgi:cation transport regulator ChaB
MKARWIMFYNDISKLPTTIREILPAEAQHLYLETYNAAWELEPAGGHQGLSRESVAHQVAWDAVNREWVHDVKLKQWYRHGEEPVLEEKKMGWWEKMRKFFR